MADLVLPPNVKLDPNTGLYSITNAQGKTVRVNADTQDQLNQYVKSVDTGVPAAVTVTDPNTGNPTTQTFDSGKIISQTDSINQQNALLTAGKRQAGVLGNSDGSYQDLNTGKTISQEQAAAKIQAAGLPPETLQAITPKNSSSYQAAQNAVNSTTNTPSNIPAASATAPSQAASADGSGPVVDASVPAAPAVPNVTDGSYKQAAPLGADGQPIPQVPFVGVTDGSYKQAAPLGADGQPIRLVPFEPVSVSTPGTGDGSYSQAAPLGADGQPMRLVPDVETPAAVQNPPYDENAGLDAAIKARAAEPVETQLTPAQLEVALAEAVEGATPSAADVDAADDKSLQDIEDIRAEAETAPGGVTFPSANNDTTSAFKALAKSQGTLQSRYKQPGNGDWRVRLSLAPNSDYLYNATDAGILAPLTATNGVIFPYTPKISTSYTADYEKYNLIHSNYRGLFYKSSGVGDVQINGTFTAQDTREAAYMLAVIHFFRSVTKMFYGNKDEQRGTPPPLVYLSGYGDYQFSNHACVVSSFNYSLPNEVDYIRTNGPNNFGPNLSNRQTPRTTSPGGINFSGAIRLANALLNKGALPQVPAQNALRSYVNNTNECTYVPTKMEIDIVLIPVQTRSQVSKQFSLKGFANGNLLKGGFW